MKTKTIVLTAEFVAMATMLLVWRPFGAIASAADLRSGVVAGSEIAAWSALGQPENQNDNDDAPNDNSNDNRDELDDENKYAPDIRKLTNKEVSRIRFMEMNAMRGVAEVERITVTLPRDVVDDFLLEMSGSNEDFRNEDTKREFLKLTPPQKVHYIAKYSGPSFADRIHIRSDPEIFQEYRKNVLPYVVRGCATAGCHNVHNEKAYGFKLFDDPKRSPSTAFANFLILSDFANESGQMINRNSPSKSLLASYLLPAKQVPTEMRHPGDVEFRPPFKSAKNPRYERIIKWMDSLRNPAEDYGLRLLPKAKVDHSPFDREDEKLPGEKPKDDRGDDNKNDNNSSDD